MDSGRSIIVENVSKSFRIREAEKSVFGALSNIRRRSQAVKIRPVIKKVTFHVNKGEMFGIIGANGAGKSTLLRLISRTIRPDSGRIYTQGKTIPMLELGTGFDSELSAVENIIIYGTVLGFRKQEIEQKVGEILKFAELETFANEKIKTFSTGMISRLAFSTAAQIEPDILLIDEILSVGDISFQKKSYQKFLEFKEKGKTIVFVSHNTAIIKQLCNRAMLILNGEAAAIGDPENVIEEYISSLQNSSPPVAVEYTAKLAEKKSEGPTDISDVAQLVNQQQFSTALGFLRDMVKTQPKNGRLNYLYGYCLHRLNVNFDDALLHYQQALENGYDEFLVRYARGSLLYEMGDYKLARSDIVRALSINPHHTGPQLVLDRILALENS